jgi:hypothetical protein
MSENILVCNVLENVDEIDETLNIYFPREIDVLKFDTISVLLSDEELAEIDEKDDTEFDTKYYGVGMDLVKDIMDNLNQQLKNSTLEQKLEALNFYLDNDAFIEINYNNSG